MSYSAPVSSATPQDASANTPAVGTLSTIAAGTRGAIQGRNATAATCHHIRRRAVDATQLVQAMHELSVSGTQQHAVSSNGAHLAATTPPSTRSIRAAIPLLILPNSQASQIQPQKQSNGEKTSKTDRKTAHVSSTTLAPAPALHHSKRPNAPPPSPLRAEPMKREGAAATLLPYIANDGKSNQGADAANAKRKVQDADDIMRVPSVSQARLNALRIALSMYERQTDAELRSNMPIIIQHILIYSESFHIQNLPASWQLKINQLGSTLEPKHMRIKIIAHGLQDSDFQRLSNCFPLLHIMERRNIYFEIV